MSKITRKQIVNTLSTAWGMPYGAVSDPIMALIEQREEEFAALVDAVSHAHKIQSEPPDVEKAMLALAAIFKAHRELMPPPPSPADKLDALADVLHKAGRHLWGEEANAIAAELREGEK